MEVGLPHIGAWGVVAASPEAVHDDFRGISAIELAIVEGLFFGGVQQFGGFLGASRNRERLKKKVLGQ